MRIRVILTPPDWNQRDRDKFYAHVVAGSGSVGKLGAFGPTMGKALGGLADKLRIREGTCAVVGFDPRNPQLVCVDHVFETVAPGITECMTCGVPEGTQA